MIYRTRKDLFEAKLRGEKVELPKPVTRREQLIAGLDISPKTLKEQAIPKPKKKKKK